MAGLEVRDFSAPDETRAPDKTKIEIVRMGGASAARMSLEPGWRWSECIKPVAGTDSCQVHHVGVIMSGTLHVAHDDGTSRTSGRAGVRDRAGARRLGRRRRAVVGYEFDSRTAEEYAKGYVGPGQRGGGSGRARPRRVLAPSRPGVSG